MAVTRTRYEDRPIGTEPGGGGLAEVTEISASTLPLDDIGRQRNYLRLVALVRVMLGIEFTVNGLNWWVKLIDPYPSISDVPSTGFVGAMILTGFLFHIVKGIELVSGIGLLLNRWVPFWLIFVFPVTMNVFFVDAIIATHLRAHIMGSGALTMSIFLMLAYFAYFAPILAMKTRPDTAARDVGVPDYVRLIWTPPARRALFALGVVSAIFGAVMLTWLGVMIVQHFTR